MIDDLELLRLIENNARLSSEEIAVMLGTTAADVEAEIKRLKDENIILGYNTIINWEKQAPDNCIGMIEVRITPVKNKGYDHMAQILSKYDKVTACYLMSEISLHSLLRRSQLWKAFFPPQHTSSLRSIRRMV